MAQPHAPTEERPPAGVHLMAQAALTVVLLAGIAAALFLILYLIGLLNIP